MIRTLFVSTQELNKGARRPRRSPATQLKTIGVIGAGFMGASMPMSRRWPGSTSCCSTATRKAADKGKAHSAKLLNDQVSKGRASAASATRCWRASGRVWIHAIKDCELIVEAVFEDRQVRRRRSPRRRR